MIPTLRAALGLPIAKLYCITKLIANWFMQHVDRLRPRIPQ